jgi:hypothetical protein
MSNSVSIPVSVGDLYDRISILEIKLELIRDEQKSKNIELELGLLTDVANTLPPLEKSLSELREKLKAVNKTIWDAEERIREFETSKDYGADFVAVARAIHYNNDRRAEIKRRLNLLAGSAIVEEKSYELPEV